MPLLTSLLLLLVVSRAFGQLMGRIGQPAVVGEILAGILLGPAILNFVQPTDHLAGIAELSVFLVVLSAGLEMEFKAVTRAVLGRGIILSMLAFVIPLGAGIGVGLLFFLPPVKALFLGLCMAITALPVAVRILENFGMLDSRIAQLSIATAIVNDVLALLLLGVILDKPLEGGFGSVLASLSWTVGKLLVFGLLVFGASRLLQWAERQTNAVERVFDRLTDLFGPEALFGVAVLFVLLFGSASENLGAHFVIGAFFGGLLLSPAIFGRRFEAVQGTINSITGGFLAPIFFAFLGLHFSLTTLKQPIFVVAVLAVAMASKIYAGILGGRLLGLPRAESVGVGIILNGRGIMELVVANIALQRGLIGTDEFSTLVLMGVVTTILTPVLFRRFAMPGLTKAPASGLQS